MLKLYPTNEAVQAPFYKVYPHAVNAIKKSNDVVIATETENDNKPFVIEDLAWFEKFSTTESLLAETWARIENRAKQGLLRRALTLDFEKHLPDGKVEIYIAVSPHC